MFAEALGQVRSLDPDDFAEYGIVGQDLDDLCHRFVAWRQDLLDNT